MPRTTVVQPHRYGVSIHARPGGRAMRDVSQQRGDIDIVSIHARPGGRAMPRDVGQKLDATQVSIHARPGGRAMPYSRDRLQVNTPVSIHARPGGRAMRHHLAKPQPILMFQSTPAPEDGRCLLLAMLGVISVCFNPRPPRRTGDARYCEIQRIWRDVSIHARPGGRAMRVPSTFTTVTGGFNPRPPRRTGDAACLLSQLAQANVSIHARPGGRAMPERGGHHRRH